MRNLTVERTKSFVGCLAKAKIYIEDGSGDTAINGVNCKFLGALKNGEKQTFAIPQEQVRIFVIADKLSRNFCSEVYTIQAGEEDVFLSGRNRFNPGAGNAFRFDGNSDSQAAANRRKGTRIGWIVLAAAVVVGGIVGFILANPGASGEPKEFYYEGMGITLNDYFKETSANGFNACYQSKDVAVFVLRETLEEDYSLDEYGQMVISVNELEDTAQLKHLGGLTFFEYDYTNQDNGDSFSYFAAVYKNGEDYWMIQFACREKDRQSYIDAFKSWAQSVRFEEKA